MITILNRREIFVGFSMEEFAKIREILSASQIKYTVKVFNPNSSGSREKSRNAFGQNSNYSCQYYVYVHKNDYETACYLINQH